MATPPSPRDVYDEQQRITADLVKSLVGPLADFLGVPKTPRLIRAIARAVFPLVVKSRKRSARLARLQYTEAKAEWGRGKPIAEPKLRAYELDHLVTAIEKDLQVSGTEKVTTEDLERVANSADLHSRNAYRNASLAHVFADEQIKGWARVDPVPPTCELCRLLISRGPVYKTEQSAGGRNKYHIGCTCIPVLVFEGQEDSYPGHEFAAEELARYRKATKGKSGKAARAAWRAAVKQQNAKSSAKSREKKEQEQKALPQ